MQQGHRHRRSRRRRRRIRQLQLLVAACILVTGVVLVCAARHSNKTEAQEMKTVEPPAQNQEPEEEPEPERDWDEEARYMAQACFGEGWICQSKTEWAAIYWNILNRVDSDDPYYPDDIIGVVTQSAQYHGYDPTNPVLPVLKELALDVIDRWQREKQGETDVGRVLPPEYLFFGGDGKHNTFRTEWDGGEYWDWSWPSPYES